MKRYLWLMIIYWGLIATVEAGPLIIFAAASTINVVQEAARAYQQQHPVEIRTSFASSSTLAKQIDQGAPAHIILSANTLWMDFLEQKQRLVPQSRFNLFGNRLVIITPKRQTLSESIQWHRDFELASIFRGRFSMGDPNHVPAGIYTKEGLDYFNWWPALQFRMVAARDVRTALVYVERGEVEMGIVYLTDALIAQKSVRIAGFFPQESHSPIVYPIALVSENKHPASQAFIDFLRSPRVSRIYERYGFVAIP